MSTKHLVRMTGWLEKWALFTHLWADLEEACGAEGFTAAWRRGEGLDVWETAEALLQELTDLYEGQET